MEEELPVLKVAAEYAPNQVLDEEGRGWSRF